MRNWFPAFAFLGMAVAGWFFWQQHHSAPATGTTHENAMSEPASVASPPPVAPPAKPTIPGPQALDNSASEASGNRSETAAPLAPGIPHEPDFTNIPPEIVLQSVTHAIHDYASMFGGNPVGTNPEITAALNGQNPRQANFINPEAGMRTNGNGELVDAWGMPYFFHQLSGTEMEIRSAGPDRKMWTSDDQVTR